jgi:hypothetical protein
MILLDDIEEKVYWGFPARRCTDYEHVGPREVRVIFTWDKWENRYARILENSELPEPQGD